VTDQPFNNSADQSERREVLDNDLRLQRGSTYHSHTNIDEEAGGRFARQQPMLIVGAAPVPLYPGSVPAWTQDRGPDEPPLGFSVDAQEPLGEPHELEASMGTSSSANEPAQDAEVRSLPLRPSNNSSAVSSPAAERETAVPAGTAVERRLPTPFRRRF
jgi:hypothetical protein